MREGAEAGKSLRLLSLLALSTGSSNWSHGFLFNSVVETSVFSEKPM